MFLPNSVENKNLHQVDPDKTNEVVLWESSLETQASLEKLLKELLVKREKYQSIVAFFLATKKPDQGDINELKQILEACSYLQILYEEVWLAHDKCKVWRRVQIRISGLFSREVYEWSFY